MGILCKRCKQRLRQRLPERPGTIMLALFVSEDTFEAAVKAVAAADPVAKAALSLFTEGAHLLPAECLRAGAAKTRRPKRIGVLTTISGDRALLRNSEKTTFCL